MDVRNQILAALEDEQRAERQKEEARRARAERDVKQREDSIAEKTQMLLMIRQRDGLTETIRHLRQKTDRAEKKLDKLVLIGLQKQAEKQADETNPKQEKEKKKKGKMERFLAQYDELCAQAADAPDAKKPRLAAGAPDLSDSVMWKNAFFALQKALFWPPWNALWPNIVAFCTLWLNGACEWRL